MVRVNYQILFLETILILFFFSLFFDKDTLKTLVYHTNEYAFWYPGPETPDFRTWFPTTVKEFRAYLEVSIWMGLHSLGKCLEVCTP